MNGGGIPPSRRYRWYPIQSSCTPFKKDPGQNRKFQRTPLDASLNPANYCIRNSASSCFSGPNRRRPGALDNAAFYTRDATVLAGLFSSSSRECFWSSPPSADLIVNQRCGAFSVDPFDRLAEPRGSHTEKTQCKTPANRNFFTRILLGKATLPSPAKHFSYRKKIWGIYHTNLKFNFLKKFNFFSKSSL